MTTTLDIDSVLWKKLDSSSLKLDITGKIRKGERPPGSTKEDIVVNCLPIANEQLQKTVANVNIFVPDITIDENVIQEKVADHARLNELTNLAIGILNEVDDGKYNYDVQQVNGPIEDKDSGSHFINIRLNFYAINV